MIGGTTQRRCGTGLEPVDPRGRSSRAPVRGSRAGCPRRARTAFTLLEILLVLMLLAIMAVFAWPVMERRLESSALPESASKVRSMLFMARSSAVMENKRYRVRFEPGVRDPFIEVEPDPIGRPGEFIAAPEPWAQEAMLLGEVQVHRVNFGRPAYLTPQSSEKEQVQSDEGLNETLTSEETQVLDMVVNPDAPAADDNRPSIVFNPDGSTEWATLILSTIAPEDDLPEETAQLWIVLDGRTGLASITEQVTQAQLADASIYIDRAKLAPPAVNKDRMSIMSPGDGMAAGMDAGSMDPSSLLGDLSKMPTDGMDPMNAAGTINTDTTQIPQKITDAAADAGLDPKQPADENGDAGGMDANNNLERLLSDPNLTEEQKDKIRKAFANGNGGK